MSTRRTLTVTSPPRFLSEPKGASAIADTTSTTRSSTTFQSPEQPLIERIVVAELKTFFQQFDRLVTQLPTLELNSVNPIGRTSQSTSGQ